MKQANHKKSNFFRIGLFNLFFAVSVFILGGCYFASINSLVVKLSGVRGTEYQVASLDK